ncbi:Glycosyl hydrolases family 28 [Chitinophaga sp. YR573]|uniref:glycoside hydrolase family 28 protein n=1 Tax=Chitinophaga sp. YR573 TaxID=1881040 RepID=UPI0008C9F052|nr:glycosyl hydrolase family 28 protein [Chitinophaga sp. YR573]SEW25310.1 Glycosyl hydrolases family 28 [Chitinophaga sp. YR573]
MKRSLFCFFLLYNSLAAFAQKDYNILNYGAKAKAGFNNAAAIQKAIDAATKAGKGRVIIPSGNFLTGPVILKSGVELHLADDAVLLGSPDRLDYTDDKMAVILASNEHDITITGKGTINGQGRELVLNLLQLLTDGKVQDSQWKLKRPGEKNRPLILSISDCKNVKVTDVTIKDASGWVQSYNSCTGVVIDHMTVISMAYWNNDGIDIVDCKDVKITNSFFNAADDGICLKSEDANKSCENIIIENCIVRSSASGFKLGTGSVGGFKKIRVNNLTVYNTYRSAIALESVDGGVIEDIDIRNVTARNTGNAIFIRLGHRNTTDKYSTIQRVYIGNVKAEIPSGKPDMGYPVEGPAPKVAAHNLVPSSITGLPGHPVKDVVLENIEISYGGGAQKQIVEVPLNNLGSVTENAAGYPEFTMFGELPAWGLYIRHAEGISLKNVRVSYLQDDFRPAIVSDDVNGLKINALSIPSMMEPPLIVLRNTNDTAFEKILLPVSAEKGILVQQ